MIDFVADCGADPTGTDDVTPALNKAGALLSRVGTNPRVSQNGLELTVPPGLYRVHEGGSVWNFAGLTTSVRVRGEGDASVFLLDEVPGTCIELANAYNAVIEGITCVGSSNVNGVQDAQSFMVTNQAFLTTFRDCRFLYTTCVGIIINVTGALRLEGCHFAACSTNGAASGVVHCISTMMADVVDCRFEDIGILNGFAFTASKVGSNTAWLCFDTPPSQTGLSVRRSFFDEGCSQGIQVLGAASPRAAFNSVRLEQCTFNTPINAPVQGVGAAIDIEQVDSFVADAIRIGNATGNANIPFVALTDTRYSRLRGLSIKDGTLARYIMADASCSYVSVDDSDYFTISDIFDGTAARSLARTSELRSLGLEWRYRQP